jgi:hypothetical protein
MILENAKALAEKHAVGNAKDCVITIPSDWTRA